MTVIERGRIVRSDTDDPAVLNVGRPAYRVLPRRLYDQLVRFETDHVERRKHRNHIIDWRRDHGIVGQWVGVLQSPGLQLEILPKTDNHDKPGDTEEERKSLGDTRANLATMLLRGGLVAVRSRGVADLSLLNGNIHDRLVDAFLDRAIFELQRGLDRGYTSEEENLLALQGKLLVGQQVTRNAAQRHRFYCRRDILSEVTPVCLRIKQACRLLAGRSLPSAVSVKVQDVLAMLDEVPDLPHRPGESDPIFTRQNERFSDVYQFSCMILAGQAADVKGGQVDTFSLLFDMDQVFERFIAAFVRSEVIPRIDGAVARAQGTGDRRDLLRDTKGSGALHLKPDLLVQIGSQALVIDTKWKRFEAHKLARPDNGDLYQLYAYLHRYECQNAYLLYPKVTGVEPRTFTALRGHRPEESGQVGVRFVNVNRNLRNPEGREGLADELTALVREGLGLPDSTPGAGVP
ncbi:MAG: McrC family protein [Polyangiaceae bacterium]|nr:McrC family protein [Polyangiaceae bacterium]